MKVDFFLFLFFLHMNIQFFQYHLLKRLSTLYYFGIFVKIRLTRCESISELSVLLIYVSFHLPISQCLDYCSFIVNLEMREHESTNSVLIFSNCIGYSGFFSFIQKFWYCFIYKNVCWYMFWDCIESIDQFDLFLNSIESSISWIW